MSLSDVTRFCDLLIMDEAGAISFDHSGRRIQRSALLAS